MMILLIRGLSSAWGLPPPQNPAYQLIGLTGPRAKVYDRINQRVEQMIENGLIEEVRKLLEAGVSPTCQAFQAIGYKEVLDVVNGSLSKEEVLKLVQQKTRHFAKRQWTWFRKFDNVQWFDVLSDP